MNTEWIVFFCSQAKYWKIFNINGSVVPEETCGHGESDKTTMAFVESFFLVWSRGLFQEI